jgi:hypothetical protein
VKRILVAALVAAIGLMGVAAAFAAPPIKEVIPIDQSVPDFCGTGETIEIEGTIRNTLWFGTTGGDPTQVVRAQINIDITYTNPETGAAVVERWSFMSTNQIISGLESGVHTHEFTENGLKAMFKLKHGGVITRDAGSLTYRVTFDENDNVTDFEAVTIHGPHPGFEYEGEDFFCDTLVPALGLD